MSKQYVNGNIIRYNNTIEIKKCNHPNHAFEFLHVLNSIVESGITEITIKVEAEAIYPNACVPIRGFIEHYKHKGIKFNFDIGENSYLVKCGFKELICRSKEELKEESQPFDKLFYYQNSGQVAYITRAYINYLSRQFVCGKGVIRSLDWCISEVMDNVLLHSEVDHGIVMAQYHSGNNKVVFCIFDDGIGIYNSLKKSKHLPRTEMDAIYLSLQEGISDGQGQGNGLFGLYQIIRENLGSLSITSGKSSIMFNGTGETKRLEKIPILSSTSRCTIIDFQLDLGKEIDLQKAFQTIGGIDDFDARLDEMLDENDFVVYDVLQNCQGTGTRIEGKSLRNDVENILKRDNNGVILDFKNVHMVSSSFIDEFIAKMVLDLGFVGFNSMVRLRNMGKEIRFLCDRSLYMRIYDTWADSVKKDTKVNRKIEGEGDPS